MSVLAAQIGIEGQTLATRPIDLAYVAWKKIVGTARGFSDELEDLPLVDLHIEGENAIGHRVVALSQIDDIVEFIEMAPIMTTVRTKPRKIRKRIVAATEAGDDEGERESSSGEEEDDEAAEDAEVEVDGAGDEDDEGGAVEEPWDMDLVDEEGLTPPLPSIAQERAGIDREGEGVIVSDERQIIQQDWFGVARIYKVKSL